MNLCSGRQKAAIWAFIAASLVSTACKKIVVSSAAKDAGAEASGNTDDNKRFLDSTIGLVLGAAKADLNAANIAMNLPTSVEAWLALLADYSKKNPVSGAQSDQWFNGTIVPFSLAPGFTNLSEPRFVAALGHKSTKTGRLFLGIIPRKDGPSDFEFISWNPKRGEYDFGVIENFGETGGKPQEISFPEQSACTACHQGKVPIFQLTSWGSTVAPPINTVAFFQQLARDQPNVYKNLSLLVDKLAKARDEANRNPESGQGGSLGKRLGAEKALVDLRINGFRVYKPAADTADLETSVRNGRYLALSHQIARVVAKDELAALRKGDYEAVRKKYDDKLRALPAWAPNLLNDVFPGLGVVGADAPDELAYDQNLLDKIASNDKAARELGKRRVAGKISPTLLSSFRPETVCSEPETRGCVKDPLYAAFEPGSVDRYFQPEDADDAPGGDQNDKLGCADGAMKEKPCESCHGVSGKREPRFGNFDPLDPANWQAWKRDLDANSSAPTRVEGWDFKSLFCRVVATIADADDASPMPPAKSPNKACFDAKDADKRTIDALSKLRTSMGVTCGE